MRGGRTIFTRAPVWILAAACAGPVGCSAGAIEHGGGRPVVRHAVAAPADTLWARLSEWAWELGLVVSRVHPEDRVIDFDWITAPGDGRLFLRCRRMGPIGSASLKPRVTVVPAPWGSTLIITSRVRATSATECASTGQFEGWLLRRLEPAIAAADNGRPVGAPDP